MWMMCYSHLSSTLWSPMDREMVEPSLILAKLWLYGQDYEETRNNTQASNLMIDRSSLSVDQPIDPYIDKIDRARIYSSSKLSNSPSL